MIIDGDDLRRTHLVLLEPWSGSWGCLPNHPSRLKMSRKRAQEENCKTFPSFDERIGWSIHGAYDDEGLPVRSRSACRRSSGPTTTRSSRFLVGGSRGGRN